MGHFAVDPPRRTRRKAAVAVMGRLSRAGSPVIGRAFEVGPDVGLIGAASRWPALPSERCGLPAVHGLDGQDRNDLAGRAGGHQQNTQHEVDPAPRISAELDRDLEAFRTRRLEGEFPYVFCDATYVKARRRRC